MAEEGGLTQLLDTLRWRWKLLVPVTLVVFVLATTYVESLPPVYTSESVVAFSPRADVPSASADTVRIVVPKYVEYVTSPATIAEVSGSIVEQPGVINEALEATIAPETGNLSITVSLPSPNRAARAADAFADQLTEFAEGDTLLEAQVVAEALRPNQPSGPPRRLLEAAALFIGLLLGIGASFVVETQRPRLRSWTDMARLSGYRVVGRVPASRKLKARPVGALADPLVGSAFRTLRTNLERESQDRQLGLIVVTSPDQGDGKTTISGLTAESFARLGTKVLFVDADLRRPNVATTFRVPSSPGLADVLRDQATLDEAIKPGWTEGLWVVPTREDADAGDLLARRFLDVISDARQRFDVIIVDTPPLLGLADARSLAAVSDGVLLVISARRMAETVNEAVLALETLKAPVLGIVGNRLREAKRAYHYIRGQ